MMDFVDACAVDVNTVHECCRVFENEYSTGSTTILCNHPPCAWWLDDGAQNPGGESEESEGDVSAAEEGSAAFNAGGRVAVPEFFIPPLSALTVELFFSPACNTTAASATQSLFRLLTETTVFSPRILLERGDVTAYVALNDEATNSSYFAVQRKLQVRPQTPYSEGGAVWMEKEWHGTLPRLAEVG